VKPVNLTALLCIGLSATLVAPLGCAGSEPAPVSPAPTFAASPPAPEPRMGRASSRKTRSHLAGMLADARASRDVVRTLCLTDKLTQVDTALQSLRERENQSSHGKSIERVLRQRIVQLGAEGNQCVGEEGAFIGDSKVTTAIEPNLPSDEDVGLGGGGGSLGAKTAATEPPASAAAPTPSAPAAPPASTGASASGARPSHASRAGGAAAAGANAVADEPQVAFSANLEMAVFQADPSLAKIQEIALGLGGHLATRGDGEITVRVPRERFVEALARIEGLGDVVHREIAAENVTDQVVELGMRLRNASALRARLEQLLEHASTKDALEIEKELARVTADIEGLEGKLKSLSHRVAYASITVDVEQKQPRAVATPSSLPFAWLDDLGLPSLLHVKR
jgi:Domain of unknown function (DUF4349)